MNELELTYVIGRAWITDEIVRRLLCEASIDSHNEDGDYFVEIMTKDAISIAATVSIKNFETYSAPATRYQPSESTGYTRFEIDDKKIEVNSADAYIEHVVADGVELVYVDKWAA